MNLQQQDRFYEMMTRLRSRAASTQTNEDVRITEMINGVLITRPAKKYQQITNNNESKTTSEPVVIDLQEQAGSKAGSVSVNKLQEILRFQRSNGRL